VNQEGWIGTSMVIIFVVLSCGAIVCAIGVAKKTRDFLHLQRLGNSDDERTNDAPEEHVELANHTSDADHTRSIEREQSLYQSQYHANHPSAPPDSSMQGMPFIPPSTLPASSTIDPPIYSDAIKF
jgi:hypothetical protein